jgi:aspartyl-tRNA(Asn)/glutamyl-tRNA(Gln) amidotransferase subunit A
MNAPVAGAELAELSMTEAADAFAAGEVKAEALVRACLARIEAHDGQVNAVIRLDREAALEAAIAADCEYSAAAQGA